jgi:hypothetical protein
LVELVRLLPGKYRDQIILDREFKLARQSGERIPDAPEVAGDQRRRRKPGIVSIGIQR